MNERTSADVLATTQALSGQVEALARRVEALEAELAEVRGGLRREDVPEEVVIVIAAAVAACLGHRARLRQVRYRPSGTRGPSAGAQRCNDRRPV